jgi:dTDP-6-deoxy-L-talose 4-dehydrogenase (NAD+)
MSVGEQLRDYQPVEASARSLAKLALDPRANGIYNVCAGMPTSVRALVEGWIREAGAPITPELGRYPYPDYEPMAFWGDATRMNELNT